MLKKDCFKVGDIIKTNGSQGELTIKFSNNLILNSLKKLESIFIEIDGILVPFFITEYRNIKNSSSQILFEDVNTIEKANDFVGRSLFLLKTQHIESLPKEEEYNIIGYSIFDNTFDKCIGEVDDVLHFKNNSVIKLIIENKEVLIPIADEIIISINDEEKLVTIVTPEGLLDVYLND